MSKLHRFSLLALGSLGLGPIATFGQERGTTITAEGLEEIVVSVQRRQERLLDVPISIASVSAEDLERSAIVGLFDLSTVMPAVRIDHYGAYAQPTVRGVGTQDVQGPGANANVAIYVDGFYLPSQAGNIFEFANVSRLDVLKGPQGTLFGQNATGGALVITTPDPSFQPTATFSIGAGSFSEERAKAYASMGFGDKVAADISVYYRSSDNYFDDVHTGKPTSPISNTAVRSKVMFVPSEATKITLMLEYTDIDDATGLSENTLYPIAAFYHDTFGVPMDHTLEPYKTSLNAQSRANPVTYVGGLTAAFDLGSVELVSRTQYRDQDASIRGDLDGTSVQYWQVEYDETEETFTQEFNLTRSGEGSLDWVTGLFYYHDKGQLRNNAYQDFFNSGTRTSWLYSDVEVTTKSIAVFGDGTWHTTDALALTAGLRYTSEEKEIDSEGLLTPFPVYSDSERWDKVTPRVAALYSLSDHANVYGSISQGFMSGNYSYTTVGPQEPVEPEEATQYEVGYKYASGGWSFNTAAFFTNYENLQVFRFASDCGCYRLDSAPKAEIYGADARLTAPVTAHLTLNAGLAYTHARYVEYNGSGLTGNPVIPPDYGLESVPTDFDGGEMIRAPDWVGNVGFNYLYPSSRGSWNVSGNYFHTSRVPLSPGGQLSQDAYGLLSLRGAWTAPNDAWTVSIYGNNVTDEKYNAFSAGGFLGNNYILGQPASWGAQLEYRF